MLLDHTRTYQQHTPEKGIITNIQKFSLNDGPGIRTVVFFKGCPLRCQWCSNPETQRMQPENMFTEPQQPPTVVGKFRTVKEIMTTIKQDQAFYEQSHGGVTFSGGEVLAQAAFATKLAKAVKAENIHLACETTGYAKPETFNKFIRWFDLVYYDCKHWDATKHQQKTGVSNRLILQNLQQALEMGINLKIRIPIIPHFNNSLADAKHFAQLFQQLGVHEVELLPFHQFGLKKYQELKRPYALKNTPQLHAEDLYDFQQILTTHGIKTEINSW